MLVEISSYQTEYAGELENLQDKYIAANPKGTKRVPLAYYKKSPENVLCAFTRQGVLKGYGVLDLWPAASDSDPKIANVIWTYIRFDPEVRDLPTLQDAVFDALMDRCADIIRDWSGQKTRLAISYPESRQDEIAFFTSKGFVEFDALLQMGRDLSKPLPEVVLPAGITVRRWTMDTLAEKEHYLRVKNKAFHPCNLSDLKTYMDSWQGGTSVTAFDPNGEIVGSMMAYWFSESIGLTEDIFVVPNWRCKGIARSIITEGMRVLIENGHQWAGLEVTESNCPALSLYQSLGYQESTREVQMALWL